jgi:predicted aconitase with swiveling domain
MKTSKTMKGRSISPGIVEGEVIVSHEPIGFYGGVDAKSGIVIDKGHELEGKSISGKILAFPCGKGSTVGSYVIYGLKRNGVAPSAIINEETETIVATGVILAGIPCVDKINLKELDLKTGDIVKVDGGNGVVKKIN